MNVSVIEDPNSQPTSPSTPLVIIKDAYKIYPPANIILNGLNLTINEGTVYGLLGASGCGKTTLLNCIAGRTNLDSGYMNMRITKRSDLGFMPQTLSLYSQLTVLENFFFYGYLFGMSNSSIKSQAHSLISFLEIPSGERLVKSLSGGQQRRVSFAVTLVHDPKILILDEPTVGLDPIISQNIWNYLLDMAKNGKTIILTTNYIQEARRAHIIGLMRNGVLLAEEPPESLLKISSTNSLEEAFALLSQKQEDTVENSSKSLRTTKSVKKSFQDDKFFSFQKLKGVMYKNSMLLRREYTFAIIQLIIPLITTVAFNSAIGLKPINLKLGVVNGEVPLVNCSHLSYKSCFIDHDENAFLSCSYLELLRNKKYEIIEYYNHELAMHDLRKNKVWALLRFPTNYTRSMANRVNDGIYASAEDLSYSFMDVWIDLSNQYIGSLIKYDVLRAVEPFLENALINCDVNPKLGSNFISYQDPIYGTFDENFITYASSALLCIVSFFTPLLSTALMALLEKMEGIMERMMVAGVSPFEMIASLTIIQLGVHVIQTFVVMIVLFWIYDNPFKGSLVTVTLLILLTGTSGMFHGFLLAAVCDTVFLTGYGAVGVNFLLCLTSGLLWPTEGIHYLIKSIQWLIPISWTVDAVRAVCAKNFSYTHYLVLRGFASVIMWNILMFSLICWFVIYRKGRLESRK